MTQALQHELANLTLGSMPNLDAYCQRICELTDQLNALDFTMNDQQRVLYLVKGLPKEFDTIASILNNSLPSWEDAVEQLLSEAGRLKTRDAVTSTTSAIAAAIPPNKSSTNHNPLNPSPSQPTHSNNLNPSAHYHNNYNQSNRGPPNRNTNRNNSRPNYNHNRGPNNHSTQNFSGPTQQSYNRNHNPPPPYPNNPHQPPYYPPFWAPPYWTSPPCPYPTQSWTQPWQPQSYNRSQYNRDNNRSAQTHFTEIDPLSMLFLWTLAKETINGTLTQVLLLFR
ncbi:uncharacterized protein DDB_G0287625-like [Helianthus annuus]|uniref:uncharacterized protein DDB_G0287625-like n=1 Tax=Helianthus annuus TaxID=4232 RepID=UPI000B8EFD61|nr:uncharacterized protein DDB_G0287625-like [Helianthus annuus]